MLSGYYSGFPNDILLDHATLLIGNNVLSPSRGGTRFSPGPEYRVVEYDGQRAEVEGLRRIVGWNARITGTWLFVPEPMLPVIEPGIVTTNPPGPYTARFSPRNATTLFQGGDYLTNLRLVGSRYQADGDEEFFQVRFPLAVISGDWSIVTNDKNEALLEGAEFKAILPSATAAADPSHCPYLYEVLSRVS